jgi:Predicted glycosyltransferases
MSKNNSSKWGLIKKALYIWAYQYHFIIPRKILKGYIHKYHTESENISKFGKRFFDPNSAEDYNQWLSFQTYRVAKENFDITFIGNDLTQQDELHYPRKEMKLLDLSGIKSKYICITSNNCRLYEPFESYLNECTKYDITYFDNDRIDEKGNRCCPWLKPDFSYDTLRGFNYIGSTWVIRRDLLDQFNGGKWEPYRWLLELSDQTVSFGHVSKVLYGDSENKECRLSEVKEYLNFHSIQAAPEQIENSVCVKMNYRLAECPLVSIIIPTKDGKGILKTCLDSVFETTTYKNLDIIIADNGSTEQETISYFEEIQALHSNVHVFDCRGPFNFSLINNRAVFQHAHGDYIVLLNNDISVITPDWIEKMLAYAQQKHVGSVGAMLYYPDGTIQHAGVITGKGGGLGAHRYYRKPHDSIGYMHTLEIANDVSCCTAACLMVSKEKYEEVKGMNEELAVQYNDVDFGLRLLNCGYYNVFLPDVKMIHDESKSRGIDKNQSAVDRYVNEVEYAKEHYAEWIEHDPFYNDQFDKNYDYMLIAGKGSN